MVNTRIRSQNRFHHRHAVVPSRVVIVVAAAVDGPAAVHFTADAQSRLCRVPDPSNDCCVRSHQLSMLLRQGAERIDRARSFANTFLLFSYNLKTRSGIATIILSFAPVGNDRFVFDISFSW